MRKYRLFFPVGSNILLLFGSSEWNASVDYMFFRNFHPNVAQLSDKLQKSGTIHQAFWRQDVLTPPTPLSSQASTTRIAANASGKLPKAVASIPQERLQPGTRRKNSPRNCFSAHLTTQPRYLLPLGSLLQCLFSSSRWSHTKVVTTYNIDADHLVCARNSYIRSKKAGEKRGAEQCMDRCRLLCARNFPPLPPSACN